MDWMVTDLRDVDREGLDGGDGLDDGVDLNGQHVRDVDWDV